MGKYLKQAFVMDLERQLSRGEITHSYMVDLMQEECIKNYIAETSNTEKKWKLHVVKSLDSFMSYLPLR